MATHAQGSVQFPFDELSVTFNNQPLTCEGTMWIDFTGEHDGEQQTWDFDWKYDGLLDLTCYDSAGDVFPVQGIQHQLEPLVRAALDDHHVDIEDKIYESLSCI